MNKPLEDQIGMDELLGTAYPEAGHLLLRRFGGEGRALVWEDRSGNTNEKRWEGKMPRLYLSTIKAGTGEAPGYSHCSLSAEGLACAVCRSRADRRGILDGINDPWWAAFGNSDLNLDLD